MNKSFKNITFVATALMMLSCSSENFCDVDDTQKGTNTTTFLAHQESLTYDGEIFGSSATTRTSLASGDKSIVWTTGDAVSIWDGVSTSKYVVSETNGTSCTFTATGTSVNKSDNYEAIYPYNVKAKFEDNKIKGLYLSANQEATANSFDPSCNLMVATNNSTNSTLEFKNVCSYIKLKTTFDCSRIVIKFTNTTTIPTGTFDVAWDSENNPVAENIKNDAKDNNVVRLVGDIKAGIDYYIAVLPGTYQDGLTVTLEPKNATTMINWTTKKINFSPYHKSTIKDVVLKRAYNKSFGELDQNLAHETTLYTDFEDLFGYASLYNNGENYGDHGTIVLWAKKNIGAEEETDYGSYFAWGEVVSKGSYTSDNYLCNDYYPTNLDLSHDAATVNYGEGWKTPSDEEFAYLKEQTVFVYDATAKGYYVYPGSGDIKNLQVYEDGIVRRVSIGMSGTEDVFDENSAEYKYAKSLTPENTQHIFLPLGGFYNEKGQNKINEQGFYWTNGHGSDDLKTDNGYSAAYYLGIGTGSDRFNTNSYAKPRYYGFNIRPVFVYTW